MLAVTDMAREIQEIPDAIQRLLDNSAEHIFKASAALNQLDPRLVTTIARGSSDHAASYLKYAIELSAGIPVASTGPSIASIYGKALRLEGMATLAISQSGMSPDIVKMTKVSKREGSFERCNYQRIQVTLGNIVRLRDQYLCRCREKCCCHQNFCQFDCCWAVANCSLAK